MSAVEWLLAIASGWAVFLAFAMVDVPGLVFRAAGHLRQQHLPHWARHGHAPPAGDPDPPHGRHARH